MTTAEEVFAKARKHFEESQVSRDWLGRFKRVLTHKEAEPVEQLSEKDKAKKEILDRYDQAFREIELRLPIPKRNPDGTAFTKQQVQKVMADRARAKGKLSVAMYRELLKAGESSESLYGSTNLGDAAYLK